MSTKYLLKQISSLILPVTVLILVPAAIEKDITIKNIPAFVAGVLLMLAGALLLCLTIYNFIIIGKGTLAPWFPTGKLIVTGVYRYVRNPMISGVLIILLGESIAILSLSIFAWMILFFLINNVFFLVYEEPNLGKRFGKDYLDYKKNIPRWIPRNKPYQRPQD
jgi:protein-S-isoprenylcysteine O-methyltransferase Ste14